MIEVDSSSDSISYQAATIHRFVVRTTSELRIIINIYSLFLLSINFLIDVTIYCVEICLNSQLRVLSLHANKLLI